MVKGTTNIDFWKKQLIIYFLKHYKLYREKNSYKNISNIDEDYFYILSTELQKHMDKHVVPRGSTDRRSKRRNVFISFFIDDLINYKKKDDRDPNLIYYALQKIQGFHEYCQFNCINEDVMKSSIPFMKYEKIEKGSYLIKKGDQWTKFYLILRGRVLVKFRQEISESYDSPHYYKQNFNYDINNFSENFENENYNNYYNELNANNKNYSIAQTQFILSTSGNLNKLCLDRESDAKKKLSNVNLNERKISYYEDNKFRDIIIMNESLNDSEKIDFAIEAGKIFGDYPIINKQESAFSLMASEDTYLIYIDSGIFTELFSKSIIKAENERRIFFKNGLDIFKESHKFDEYYQRVSVVCPKKNQIIYKEKNQGNFIYLIYTGSFVLEKECKKELERKSQSINTNNSNNNNCNILNSRNKSLLGNSKISLFAFNSEKNSLNIQNSVKDAKLNNKLSNKYSLNISSENPNNKKDEVCEYNYKPNEKFLPVMNLVKGSFAGLEILFKKEENLYNYSFKANGPFNILYKLNIENFPEIKKDILEFSNSLFLKQKNMLNSLLQIKLSIKSRIDDIFEKNYKHDQGIMISKVEKEFKNNHVQKEKQKNELKAVVNKFSKKYINPKLYQEEASFDNSQNLSYYYKNKNTNKNICIIPENNLESQSDVNNIIPNSNLIVSKNNNLIANMNKDNKIHPYSFTKNIKINNDNKKYEDNSTLKEPKISNNRNSLLETSINSCKGTLERKSSSFNFIGSSKNQVHEFSSNNNINYSYNQNDNNNKNFNSEDKFKINKGIISKEKSMLKLFSNKNVNIDKALENNNSTSIKYQNDKETNNKLSQLNVFSPEIRQIKTSQMGRSTITSNGNFRSILSKEKINEFGIVDSKTTIRNSNYNLMQKSSNQVIFDKSNNHSNSNILKNSNFKKIKIKSIDNSQDEYLSASHVKNQVDSNMAEISTKIEVEKQNTKNKKKFSMDDVTIRIKPQSTVKQVKIRDIGIKTPIRNCIINWQKANCDLGDEKSSNKGNNFLNLNNSPEIKTKKCNLDENLTNALNIKNKNLNFFRTSFFNLPLISTLNGKK